MTLAEQAELAIKLVRGAPVIAFDVETSGLDWRKNHAVGYVVTGGRESSIYVPIRHGGGGNLIDANCAPLVGPEGPTSLHSFEVELADAFRERQRRGFLTVGHNIKFDAHMAANHGILLGRQLEDTQLNEALLDEYSRSFSLADCAKAHGVTPKLGDELYALLARTFGGVADKKQMEHFWKTAGNDPIVQDYAAGDGVTTLELRQEQNYQIRQQKLDQVYELENHLIWTVFRMERRGFKIDLERVEQVQKLIGEELEKARGALPTEFNVRSSKDVREFMEGNGHTTWPLTDKGNPSFTEKWLKTTPEGRNVIKVRQLSNLNNTFLGPLMEQHIHKGRIHSSLNQMKADEHGTISGRFSSSGPNLQQVPKHNAELGRLFRSIFVPDDGMELYEGDYSQCEPRLFAHYSKDPALLAGYNQTPVKDVYEIIAEFMKVPRNPIAKRMGMGIFNMMTPRTLAEHMEWPLEKGVQMHGEFFRLFPKIGEFQNLARNVFRERGYVKTILGRVCRLDDARFAHKGVSRIIQGGNADILKFKILELDKQLEAQGDEAQLLTTIHDSIVWQVPKEHGGLYASLVRGMMTDVQREPFNLRVPFVMDIGSGANWAEATYGTR